MSKLCERSNPLGVRLDGLPRRQTILPGEGSPGAPVFLWTGACGLSSPNDGAQQPFEAAPKAQPAR